MAALFRVSCMTAASDSSPDGLLMSPAQGNPREVTFQVVGIAVSWLILDGPRLRTPIA